MKFILHFFTGLLKAKPRPRMISAINQAGTHSDTEGGITRWAESAFSLAHLTATLGTTPAKQVKPCGATDEPVGTVDDEAALGEICNVLPLSSASRTRIGVASKAITAGSRVYTTASGKLTDSAVNNSYLVGRAWTAAAADGDEFEFEPCFPVKQTVGG